jgi:hypothetical protein
LLPPPHPGLFPGKLTCTDACRRAAGGGAVLRHTPLPLRPVGRACSINAGFSAVAGSF